MLRDGEIALLPDAGGLAAISDVAHQLRLLSVPVIRTEPDEERQHETVMATQADCRSCGSAGVSAPRSPPGRATGGQMTLLVHTARALEEDERRRIDRFVATLGR